MATGQTPTYLLPYPLSTDPVDVHGDIFELADRLEDVIGGISVLPSQSGNNGKFLTTNGSAASWATVDALPSQSGNNGKYLTTNGSIASWATVAAPASATPLLEGILYGQSGETSDENISLGYHSLKSSTGTRNIAIGWSAGYRAADEFNPEYTISGDNNIIIGSDALMPEIDTISDQIVLGNYSHSSFTMPGFGLNYNSTGIFFNAGINEAIKYYPDWAIGATDTIALLELEVDGSGAYAGLDAEDNWSVEVYVNDTTDDLVSDVLFENQSRTMVLMVPNGATAYYHSGTFSIDGDVYPVKWQGGTAPTAGNANSIDIYTYTIFRYYDADLEALSYKVFGSMTKFA